MRFDVLSAAARILHQRGRHRAGHHRRFRRERHQVFQARIRRIQLAPGLGAERALPPGVIEVHYTPVDKLPASHKCEVMGVVGGFRDALAGPLEALAKRLPSARLLRPRTVRSSIASSRS
jgi:hypothetical protein